jgi:hypothetical protein
MELERMNQGKLLKEMAGHTGQSSQLFPVATGRNAQFLAPVARSGLAEVPLSDRYLLHARVLAN